jgi:hypothetical protein
MWDLLDWIISPAVEYFAAIYRADNRPEARRFAIGCTLVFVGLTLLVGALFYYFG